MEPQTEKQQKLKALISTHDCRNIIKKALDSDANEVIDYQIAEHNNEGLGFLGQYFQLTVKVKKENEAIEDIMFFVKSLPLENQSLKDVIEEYGFFRKEVEIYKTIFSQMKKQTVETKWHPDCYLVRDGIIVCEDLKIQGYDHTSKQEVLPESHLRAGLTSLARMHSSTFDLEQNVFSENEKIYEKYNETFFETFTTKNTWMTSGIKFMEVLALKHPVLGEKYKKQIESNLLTIMQGVFDLLEPSKKFKNVLCHRDLWINNLMFKKSEMGTSCVLVDYQICRVCPPAYDFLLFVYFHTRKSVRNEKFKEYQEFYYSTMLEECRKLGIHEDRIPSHNEFLESCEFYKLMSLVFSGAYFSMTHLPANFFSELEASDPEKYNHVCTVDRSEIVFDYMDKNEYYRDYLYEIAGELIEELIIKK